MIRFTQQHAAYFILHQNYLLSPADSSANIFQRVIGLPGHGATPRQTLATRLARSVGAELQQALYETRTLIRVPLMQDTPFVITLDDYRLFYAATARQRKQDYNALLRTWQVENEARDELSLHIRKVVGQGSLTYDEIVAGLLEGVYQPLSQTSRGGRTTETSNIALILRWMVAEGIFYASPLDIHNQPTDLPAFTHPTAFRYGPFDQLYPDLNLTDLPKEAEAQSELVRRYLSAFGPATEADISFWSGLGKSETARAISKLMAKTTMALVETVPGMLLMLKEHAPAARDFTPPAEPNVLILPADDPYTTAYRASRTRYFSNSRLQRKVLGKINTAKPTILVNGLVVGTWDETDYQLLDDVDPAVVPTIEAKLDEMRLV